MKTITQLSFIVMLLCGFSFAKAQVPPTAPPDLAYPADDVLSFFSEKYGEAFPNMASAPWGQTSTWDYTATGDDEGLIVLKNLEWLPIALAGNADIKQYSYVHVDVFCNTETLFRIGFHRHYPDTREQYFPMIEATSMVPGKWYSIDYPIADFLVSWENYAAHYLRFGGNMEGETYKYADEIYITNFLLFNGEPTCLGGVVRNDNSSISSVSDDLEFNLFVADNKLNYSAKESIKSINIYSVSGQIVKTISVNALASDSDISNLASGVYIVSAEFKNGKKANLSIIK